MGNPRNEQFMFDSILLQRFYLLLVIVNLSLCQVYKSNFIIGIYKKNIICIYLYACIIYTYIIDTIYYI
jgi:hypothetical protein